MGTLAKSSSATEDAVLQLEQYQFDQLKLRAQLSWQLQFTLQTGSHATLSVSFSPTATSNGQAA